MIEEDLGGVVHANNGELCRFAMHWEMDGDYIRCRKCKQPQLTSYADQEFRHTPACKAAGKVETHPWITYLRLLIPVADLLGVTRTHSAEIAGALRDAERWRPIESAPKDGTKVLLCHSGYAHPYYDRDRMPRVWVDFFRGGGWYNTAPSGQPTHWRPLPAPPTQDSAMQQGGGGGDHG